MKCLAQGHNFAPEVRIEPATLRSRVRLTVVLFYNNSIDVMANCMDEKKTLVHWDNITKIEVECFIRGNRFP